MLGEFGGLGTVAIIATGLFASVGPTALQVTWLIMVLLAALLGQRLRKLAGADASGGPAPSTP